MYKCVNMVLLFVRPIVETEKDTFYYCNYNSICIIKYVHNDYLLMIKKLASFKRIKQDLQGIKYIFGTLAPSANIFSS